MFPDVSFKPMDISDDHSNKMLYEEQKSYVFLDGSNIAM